MKMRVRSSDSAPLPIIAATRARGRNAGTSKPIGRRLLMVAAALVMALGIADAAFLLGTL